MINSVNKLYLKNNKCQTNGTVGDDNYNIRLLFTIRYFVSFGTDHQ